MRLAFFAAVLLFAGVSAADTVRTVDGSRLTFGDLLDGVSSDVASLDAGPAPQPGATRIVTKGELEQKLAEHHLSGEGLRLPNAVRVLGASRRLAPSDVSALAEPAIRAALPAGVEFVKVELGAEVVTSPRARLESVDLGRFPRRAGVQRASALLVFGDGLGQVLRVPVTVIASLSEEAARPDVFRNGRLSLLVQRGAMRIAADGAALADGSVGEVLPVRVSSTGRVVRARLLNAGEAELMESP